MDLTDLRYLTEAVDAGTITEAGDRLHVAQPAVSRRIARLEDELGVPLLRRSRRGVDLTAAGRALLPHAKEALRQAELAADAARAAGAGRSGRVRVGAIHWLRPLDLPAILANFAAEHPGVELVLQEWNADEMLESLRRGELDLVLFNVGPGGWRYAELSLRPLFREEVVVMSPLGGPFDGVARMPLERLSGHHLIGYRRGSAFRDFVDAALRAAGVPSEPRLETSDLASAREFVAEGLGVALVPASLAEAPGALVAVSHVGPTALRRTVGIAWRDDHVSPAAAALRDFTVKWAASRLDPSGATS
jgi:DNA-binding transcriptional LysR family regulator